MAGIRDFRDKVVLVTGAGSGIGRATAVAFAAQGAKVVLADIRGESVRNVARDIEAGGGVVLSRQVDVSDYAEVADLAQFVLYRLGRVDIVVNNAGVGLGGTIMDNSLDDWRWLMGVNLWGVVHGMKAFLPHLAAQRSGHVVNTASLAGLVPSPGAAAYSAAKHAVVALSAAARIEMRRYNVGVTAICPGLVDTSIVSHGRVTAPEGSRIQREDLAGALSKWGWPPERVARAVLRAVRRNTGVAPLGAAVWLMWLTRRLTPGVTNAIGQKLYDRMV